MQRSVGFLEGRKLSMSKPWINIECQPSDVRQASQAHYEAGKQFQEYLDQAAEAIANESLSDGEDSRGNTEGS